SSRPNSSISASESATGSVCVVIRSLSSDLELTVARRGVDADEHLLARLAVDLPGAQVADEAGAKDDGAGVAYPHAAAVLRVQPRVLSDAQQRKASVRLDRSVGVREAHAAARHTLGKRRQCRVEALEVEPALEAGRAPVRLERVEETLR